MLITTGNKLLADIERILGEVRRFESRLNKLKNNVCEVIALQEDIEKKESPRYWVPDIDHKLLAAAKRASLDLSYELPKWRKAVKE